MSWVHKFDMHFFFYIAITLLDFDKKQVAQCWPQVVKLISTQKILEGKNKSSAKRIK